MGYTDIKELLKDAKNIATGANELQLKSLLLDIQDKVYDLQDENRDLREENHSLKNEKILESELYKEGMVWRRAGNEYRYCPKCYGKDDKLIVCDEYNNRDFGHGYECPVCYSSFEI